MLCISWQQESMQFKFVVHRASGPGINWHNHRPNVPDMLLLPHCGSHVTGTGQTSDTDPLSLQYFHLLAKNGMTL